MDLNLLFLSIGARPELWAQKFAMLCPFISKSKDLIFDQFIAATGEVRAKKFSNKVLALPFRG